MWAVHEKQKISYLSLSSTLFHGLAWLDPSQEGGYCPLIALIQADKDYHYYKNIFRSLSALYIIISVHNVFVVTLQSESVLGS